MKMVKMPRRDKVLYGEDPQPRRTEDRQSPGLVPCLDLQLSSDDGEFDDLNKMFSNFNPIENEAPENKGSGQGSEGMKVKSCFNNKKKHQHCILDIEELIMKLEQSLSKKIMKALNKIPEAYLGEIEQNSNKIIWQEYPLVLLIKHLRSLHAFSAGKNDEDRNESATQAKESCAKRESRYCIKKKEMKTLSKEELFKISLVSMNDYNDLVNENIATIDKISGQLEKEKEGSKELRDKVQKLEEERKNQDIVIEDMKQARNGDQVRFEEDQIRFEEELRDEREKREDNEKMYKKELENMKIEREKDQIRFKGELRNEKKKRQENEERYRKEMGKMKTERGEHQIRFENDLQNERNKRQENEETYRKEIEKKKIEREEDQVRYKEEILRIKEIRNGMEKEHQNELEKMKRKVKEVVCKEEETKRTCEELIQQMKINLKIFENGKMTETERFEKCLVGKDAENKRLRAEISKINASLNKMENEREVFMKMKEELQEKEKLINKMTAKFEDDFLRERGSNSSFEGNSQNIQTGKSGSVNEESSFENIKEMKYFELKEEDLSLTEDDDKVKRCGCENAVKSKHQHIIDAVREKGIHPEKSSNQSETEEGSVKAFAILKVEDMWEEQIACHQSNVEKLKDMQNLRKDLIKNREQLERSLKENQKLRESLRNKTELQETRLKLVLNKKIIALQKNEEIVENLKMNLIEEKAKVKQLTKELQKSFMMQKNKDEEIDLLNATVKAENNNEYCIITMRSMNNFKTHLKKLKDENNGVLNYCDRVEEKISNMKRELELTRKLGSDLSNREQTLKKRCEELELEVGTKDGVLKELKESQRILQQKYENTQEEMKDRKYEAGTYFSKVANSQRRLIEFEKENNKSQEQNSELKKKLAETSRDLQKSIDLVCQLKIRYEDVEVRFKEQDEKIKQFTEDVMLKENEIKDLYEELKRKGNDLERVEKDLEESKERSDLDRSKLMTENDKYKEESSELNKKLRNSEDDLEYQKKIVSDKTKEVHKLTDEIIELESKIKDFEKHDQNKGYRTEIERLQCKLKIAEEEKEHLRKEVERIQNENKLLEDDNDKLFERETRLEKENKDLHEELKELEKKVNQREQQGFKVKQEAENHGNRSSSKTEERRVFPIAEEIWDGNHLSGSSQKKKGRTDAQKGSCNAGGHEEDSADRRNSVKSQESSRHKEETQSTQNKPSWLFGDAPPRSQREPKNPTHSGEDFPGIGNGDKNNAATPQSTNSHKEQQQQQHQSKMSWLFGDTPKSSKEKDKKGIDSLTDDSVSEFLFGQHRPSAAESTKASCDEAVGVESMHRRISSSKNDSPVGFLTDNEKKPEGEEEPRRRSSGGRRRGQSRKDAADELRRLSEF